MPPARQATNSEQGDDWKINVQLETLILDSLRSPKIVWAHEHHRAQRGINQSLFGARIESLLAGGDRFSTKRVYVSKLCINKHISL
jgi:hypothetical protein